ncbi:hypothetical protein HII31_03513 [Pseudocercospora fuligena]|uniref:Oxidoreductase acuF-like C2H2 type zinc-finger domain-containing protein n=1 Tax=Pseudocercospora fuligena TaxID=685502 RepID=A0A8H6RR56_9PEZI|nr:hypothetical protein HII31_03513 [Pseudocercospora fuligena]
MSPDRKYRIRAALSTSSNIFKPHFVAHIRETSQLAPEWLAQRLGRGMSKNRGYVDYRESHRKKKHSGLNDDENEDEIMDEGATTLATPVPDGDASNHLMEIDSPQRNLEDRESTMSMTSYAGTEIDSNARKPPPLPEEGRNGDPFDCPICHDIVEFQDDHSWRSVHFAHLRMCLRTS